MSESVYFVKEPRWRNPNLDWRGGSVSIPAHTHRALVEWIEEGRDPMDDFFDSLLTNDLKGAVHAADDENLVMLPHIVGWMYNFCPSGAQGSRERMLTWKSHGGLCGAEQMKTKTIRIAVAEIPIPEVAEVEALAVEVSEPCGEEA